MHGHSPKTYGIFCLLVFCALCFFGNAAAVSVTESPDHILQGDLVTLSVQGLPDQSVFSLVLQGEFTIPSGSSYTFQTSHFVMPFTLKNGEIHATVDNANQAFLDVTRGEQAASIGKTVIPDGHFSYSVNRSIPAGTYDSLSLKGVARDSSRPVETQLQLTGIKTGPEDGAISFNVDGIESGTLHVTVSVDGSEALNQDIVIGTPQTTAPEDSGTFADGVAATPEKTPLCGLLVLPAAGLAYCLYRRRTGGA
jgi:hypothetical protein